MKNSTSFTGPKMDDDTTAESSKNLSRWRQREKSWVERSRQVRQQQAMMTKKRRREESLKSFRNEFNRRKELEKSEKQRLISQVMSHLSEDSGRNYTSTSEDGELTTSAEEMSLQRKGHTQVCGWCQKLLKPNQNVLALPCHHTHRFHRHCIKDFVSRASWSEPAQCPYDRKPIDPDFLLKYIIRRKRRFK